MNKYLVNSSLKEITHILHHGAYSCVLKNSSNEIFTYTQHGVRDLYEIINSGCGLLNNAIVADKAIGKAAAALLIIGGIKAVYADIISVSAYDLLTEHGIDVEFVEKVGSILNRNKTSLCPMEKMCDSKKSVNNIYLAIEEFLSH